MADSEVVPECEAASPAVPKREHSRDGGAAAEAEPPFFPLGDAEVGNAAAALAGGCEAVRAAEADGKPPAEAEAEAEGVVGVAVEAV